MDRKCNMNEVIQLLAMPPSFFPPAYYTYSFSARNHISKLLQQTNVDMLLSSYQWSKNIKDVCNSVSLTGIVLESFSLLSMRWNTDVLATQL